MVNNCVSTILSCGQPSTIVEMSPTDTLELILTSSECIINRFSSPDILLVKAESSCRSGQYIFRCQFRLKRSNTELATGELSFQDQDQTLTVQIIMKRDWKANFIIQLTPIDFSHLEEGCNFAYNIPGLIT